MKIIMQAKVRVVHNGKITYITTLISEMKVKKIEIELTVAQTLETYREPWRLLKLCRHFTDLVRGQARSFFTQNFVSTSQSNG